MDNYQHGTGWGREWEWRWGVGGGCRLWGRMEVPLGQPLAPKGGVYVSKSKALVNFLFVSRSQTVDARSTANADRTVHEAIWFPTPSQSTVKMLSAGENTSRRITRNSLLHGSEHTLVCLKTWIREEELKWEPCEPGSQH